LAGDALPSWNDGKQSIRAPPMVIAAGIFAPLDFRAVILYLRTAAIACTP